MARGEPGEQEYTPQVSPEVMPRKIIPEVRRTPLVQGIEGLAGAVKDKYESDVATYAGNELSDLRVGMLQQMEQLKASAHPGADGYTQQVLDAFDARAKQYDMSNPYLARAMGPGLSHLRASFGAEAVAYEAQAGVKYRQQSAIDTSDKLATIAASHPDQASDLVGQALAQVRSSRLGPEVELETARYAEASINKSAVIARIGADPYKTMQELLKPENADVTIQGLKPAEREVLLQHADAMLHQRVADAERLESMRDRDERREAAAALSGLMAKSQSPEGLSVQDVMKVAPVFRHEPQALSAALSLAAGKSVETDPHIFLPLFQRAQAGEDVASEVMAHVGRDINLQHATTLLAMGDRGLPNAHKQALDDVDGFFKQGLFDKYDPSFNSRHVQAKDAMMAWLRANPNASPAQASYMAGELSRTFLPTGDAIATLEVPRFLQGTRIAPDIDKTILATRNAELSHRISHEEAVQQLALVAQWAAVMDRAARAAQQKGAPQ